MLGKARCPLCTLTPPCKHYQSSDEIVSDAFKVINQPQYKEAISPKNRENLLQSLKRQTNYNQNATFVHTFNKDQSH
jgi:hypothetical protein